MLHGRLMSAGGVEVVLYALEILEGVRRVLLCS
jgi:hypothetical protein